MSRPLRLLFPAVLVASTLGFTGCVGTIYDQTYSYHKNHFKPPEEKHVADASAESILGALDKNRAPAAGADAAGLPPAGDIPGLPAPGLPDAGAAPAPAVPPPAAPPN